MCVVNFGERLLKAIPDCTVTLFVCLFIHLFLRYLGIPLFAEAV
jgi:hypothetical protein